MNLLRVSIVVTAYLEKSKEYLDACIQSIHNLHYPKELIDTVIVTPRWYQPQYQNCKTIHPCFGSYHNPIAINYGVAQSDQSSKYILILNDDVILTKNSLIKMVIVAGDSDVILGAISNCDNFGLYDAELPLGINQRQFRLEEVRDKLPAMMNADLPTGPIKIIRPHTLYLYANLIPRTVWAKIADGTTSESIGFDERYKTGYDDTDYCIRAQRAGVVLGISTDTLIWHASGTSADSTMGDLNSDLRADNEKAFKQKWNFA